MERDSGHPSESWHVDSRLKCNIWIEARECLCGGKEVETFSRRMIVSLYGGEDVIGGDGIEVGFARQAAAEASDGIFDAAFLPG